MNRQLIILFFGLLFIGYSLSACSCIGKSTVKQAVKNSDCVVSGNVISKEFVTLIDSSLVNTLAVEKTERNKYFIETTVVKYQLVVATKYKGCIKADTITIYTGLGHGDCGFNFELTKNYIIYGTKETYFGQSNNDWKFPKGKNIMWTDSCSRTSRLNETEKLEIEKHKKAK